MSAAAEQITLHSEELQSITPTKEDRTSVQLELQQLNKLHNYQRHVQIYDSNVIHVVEKVNKRSRSYMLNLALLDNNPVRVRKMEPKFLLVALSLVIGAILLGYLKTKGLPLLSSSYVYAGVGLLGFSSLIPLALALRSYKNLWVFFSARGRIPIVVLYHNLPDRKQFGKFIAGMSEHIVAAKQALRIPQAQLLPLEVGEHRRLCDEGIISKSKYEFAKKNILQN